MAKIGYAWVSTRGQNDDSQVDELTAYGVDKLFIDHGVSDKHASRPELASGPSRQPARKAHNDD